MTKKSPQLKRKDGLYLKDTGAKGRGVFCQRDIRPGELLEVTAALVLNEQDTDFADRTRLKNYTFTVGRLSRRLAEAKKLKSTSGASCVIMGIISFCNHSTSPNAEVVWEEKNGTVYHSLRATRKIPRHTEICTSYGRGWFGDRKEKPR